MATPFTLWKIRIAYNEFAISENPIVHENSESITEFAYSLDPTIHAKNFSMFYTELKFVQFWLIFA